MYDDKLSRRELAEQYKAQIWLLEYRLDFIFSDGERMTKRKRKIIESLQDMLSDTIYAYMCLVKGLKD